MQQLNLLYAFQIVFQLHHFYMLLNISIIYSYENILKQKKVMENIKHQKTSVWKNWS